MEEKKYIVKNELSGERIDKALVILNNEISRTMVKKLIEDEKILLNNKIPKVSEKVYAEDEIVILPYEIKEIDISPENIPLDIIYEDNDILVINKQKGIVVHPGNGNLNGTIVNAVMAYCKEDLSGIGGEIRPGIVHRIDKDTSGLLIIAKNDKAHIKLSEDFKEHKIKKTYIALVRGRIEEKNATINMPIARSNVDRTKMAVSKNGKNAVTHFSVLEKFDKYTLLKINIETGRTHQIRVHMAEIGHPIIGDYVYSNGKNEFGVEGQMLHSYEIEFNHPITNENLKLIANLPKYFENVLLKLRNK